MAYEAKPNTGSLFRNDRKEEGDDRAPDYNGSVDIDGVAYWLNGWARTSKGGKRYLSLSIKPKVAAPETTKPNFDDSIEF